MKYATTGLTALGAAVSLACAAGTPCAHARPEPELRASPVALATTEAFTRSGDAFADGGGVDSSTPYCMPSYTQGVHPISHVRGMGIDNHSDATFDASPSLEDFTTIVGQVQRGDLVDMSVSGRTAGGVAESVKVYVDWNQDGLFDEITEGHPIGFLLGSGGTDNGRVKASIRVPTSARTGETRMRVVKALDPLAHSLACNMDGAGWGQAEDYTLYVGGVTREAIFCSDFGTRDRHSCEARPPADIVYSGPLNLDIPPTGTGLRINFVTGEAMPGLPAYHFLANKGDPYLFGPALFFSWGPMPEDAGTALPGNGPYEVLGAGDTIGPASTFTRHGFGTPGIMSRYWAGVNGYLGVRFLNEDTGAVNYGYVHLLTTHGSGFPAMILDYAYDRSGAAITIP